MSLIQGNYFSYHGGTVGLPQGGGGEGGGRLQSSWLDFPSQPEGLQRLCLNIAARFEVLYICSTGPGCPV